MSEVRVPQVGELYRHPSGSVFVIDHDQAENPSDYGFASFTLVEGKFIEDCDSEYTNACFLTREQFSQCRRVKATFEDLEE